MFLPKCIHERAFNESRETRINHAGYLDRYERH